MMWMTISRHAPSIPVERPIGGAARRLEPPARDLGLVRRCRAEDESAWRTLYEENYRFVFRVARRLGTPEDEADDVAQEVFVIVLAKLDTFSDGKLTTWLYRITANVVSHHHRKRRARRAVAEWRARLGLGSPPSPEDLSVRASQRNAVGRILEQMSPKRREVFALFELEGLSGEEIVERLGWPLGTVWSRLRLARRDFLRIGRRLGVLEGS